MGGGGGGLIVIAHEERKKFLAVIKNVIKCNFEEKKLILINSVLYV